MVNVNDLTITSLETITAFDVATGDYKFTLDELQNTTISQGQEKTDITGKGGRKLNSLKKNKTVTISGSNGLISGGLLEVQTGGNFENKATEVLWVDYLTVASSKATTSYKAIGTICQPPRGWRGMASPSSGLLCLIGSWSYCVSPLRCLALLPAGAYLRTERG